MLIVLPLFIGTTEILLIGGIALLIFGGKKLPEMMRGLGKGINEFKKGMNEKDSEPTETTDPTEPKEVDSASKEETKRE